MIDALFKSEIWFLVLLVAVLGVYFLWSVRNLVNDLKASIRELRDTISELFDHRNDHEKRITAIETRCEMQRQLGGCK